MKCFSKSSKTCIHTRTAAFYISYYLAHTELRKPAKGEDTVFRYDVRVNITSSGLYEWLLEVINVSGVIGGEEGGGVPNEGSRPGEGSQESHIRYVRKAFALSSLLVSNKRLMPLHSSTP
ncbi:hypothetical protein BD769DRAFT_1422702 [Suillus cothurnatus]|nr:hypothetical protein BD769DRAFT_1422702 [Suillus cothurnatus]